MSQFVMRERDKHWGNDMRGKGTQLFCQNYTNSSQEFLLEGDVGFYIYLCLIALMGYGAEGGQGAAARLYADSSVLRQIIIDKYSATGQYVRLLL